MPEEIVKGSFEKKRRNSVPKPVSEEMFFAPPEEEKSFDELENEHFDGGQEESEAPRDDEKSFASLGRDEENFKPYELTEEGAIIFSQFDDEEDIEAVFRLPSNGEMLECEVERRKLLGGSLFPNIVDQAGNVASDPMNDIALMVAVLKRAITAPRNLVAQEMNGSDPDYLDKLIPVYKAFQEWREKRLEDARKKAKKSGSKFASK